MKNQPKSWKAVLDKRRRENFIGRTEHLRVFTENFTRELPDYMVFSVTGEGGVGKSTLLLQFANIVKQQNFNAIIVISDDRHATPVQVIGHIAAELAKSDISHREFDERYKKYREIREEIESDPNAPRGAIDLLARVGTDFVFKSARKIPGAAPLLENIDEKATGETISQLVQYGITKWSNKDERSLLLDPDRILTPLFLGLLAKVSEKQPLVLMFDVFERTSQSLSRWLLQLFNFEYGDFDTNLTFVIAGRDSLEQHWTELAGSICHIALEPFTLDETRLYLANQGITDESLAMQIHEDTGGLPVLVELLAATKPQPGMPLPDVSKDAVERFLQWVPQEDRRRVVLVAAVLRQFNRDILTALLGDEATNAFGWLSTQSFVHVDRERGWFYHEKVRELMLRHLHNTTPKDLDDAHSQLAEYFVKEQTALNLESETAYDNEAWRMAECERIYHTFSTQSEPNKIEVINAFFHAFRFQKSVAANIALTSKQVGREKGVKSLSKLAAVLSDIYSAYDADDYQIEIDKLKVLKDQQGLTVAAKSTIYARLGYAYLRIGDNDQSLATLNYAVEHDPTYVGAIINRGITHMVMDRYMEALEDFSRAIELDPKSIAALSCRGMTYRLMKKYEEALIDFGQVISMDDKSAEALEDRAETYRMMGKYEEALADFNRAVELDEKVISDRGFLYLSMGKYDEALTDLNRAIEIHNESAALLSNRGVIYGSMDKYKEALADFNRAIELDESSTGALTNRGLTQRLMGRYEEALTDFSRAIELDEKSAEIIAQRGQTYGMMGRYEEAMADFNRAVELEEKSETILANRGITRHLMEKYEEALTDFSGAIKLNEKFTDALVRRGVTYRHMERYEEAITDFNRAIKLDPKDVQAITGLGLTYQMMGRRKQALIEFSRAIEIDKKHLSAIVNRGETYRLMGRREKAIIDFDRAIKLDEQNAYVFARRGSAYHEMARYREALVDFDRAIEFGPNYAWALVNRGKVYRDMGRYEEALADLNRAIEIDGNLALAYKEIGIAFRLMGKYEDALVSFDTAMKLDNDTKDDVSLAWRGEINRRLGRYEEAINDLSKAIKSNPKDSFSISRRAAVYLVTGKIAAAKRDFSQILTTTPKAVADYYNRGIAFVIFQRASEAIKVLKEAFKLDTAAYLYAATDDLLDPIRNSPEFQELISNAPSIERTAVYH